jgi:hypothetical protein
MSHDWGFIHRRSRALAAAIGIVITIGSAGCARNRGDWKNADGSDAGVRVRVENNNFADMDVYVVSEGIASRLGTVTGNSTQQFVLNRSFIPAQDLRIVATPIGGNGRASSGPILVQPGQEIDFTINPLLRASSASVR